MYVVAFCGHVGARVCFAYPPSTFAARYSSSYVCVGLGIRTYVARYLVLEVHFSWLENSKSEVRCVWGGSSFQDTFFLTLFPTMFNWFFSIKKCKLAWVVLSACAKIFLTIYSRFFSIFLDLSWFSHLSAHQNVCTEHIIYSPQVVCGSSGGLYLKFPWNYEFSGPWSK